MAYFEQTGPSSFRPTEHASGAWKTDEQHIAPALGLLAHVVTEDQRERREDQLFPARLSYEIWGTAPLAEMTASVQVVRGGRTIELVEARLECAGRTITTLRAWLLQARDTSAVAGTPLASIPQPDQVPAWDPTTVWPGGLIASIDVRREEHEPGRAHVWVRPREELIAGVQVGALARFAGMFDVINGMTVREDPGEVAFPNVDLTAHLVRLPEGDWLGFDTAVTFGGQGAGVTESVLHDVAGPIGTLSQILTVRP